MSAMTNILVKDDTVTTPVEFTLQPITDTPDPIWRTSLASVPLSGQIQLTLKEEKWKGDGRKMTVKLEVPVQETLGASGTSAGYVAPQKTAYVMVGIFTLFSDARSTQQNRADTLKMLIGVLQGASSTTATGILSNTAAGNAFVNSTLPITEALVKVIKPN